MQGAACGVRRAACGVRRAGPDTLDVALEVTRKAVGAKEEEQVAQLRRKRITKGRAGRAAAAQELRVLRPVGA